MKKITRRATFYNAEVLYTQDNATIKTATVTYPDGLGEDEDTYIKSIIDPDNVGSDDFTIIKKTSQGNGTVKTMSVNYLDFIQIADIADLIVEDQTEVEVTAEDAETLEEKELN